MNTPAPKEEIGGPEFLKDLLAGLAQEQKQVPGKYLWDETGSIVFDQICAGEDYYPTHREVALLRRHAADIAEIVGPRATLVEYGSGASHKIRTLLDALIDPRVYVAIDISREFLEAACARIARDYPQVKVVPVYADYTKPILLEIAGSAGSPLLGFFPGATIGNFDQAGAVSFLARARATLGKSWFLVGMDPNRDRERLARAYADRDGLMARLHENLVHRIAREVDTNLDPGNFRHEIHVFDSPARVEAHLAALRPADYDIGGTIVSFRAGETIHTDTSYKYSPELFQEMATRAGWTPVRCWMDEQDMFSLHLLQS